MNLPTQAGRYLAVPTEWAVSNSSKGLPQFVCQFAITSMWDQSQMAWVDVTMDNLEITAYLNLVYQKDGQAIVNEINVKQISESLGWDGAKFDTLNNGDWSQVEVQLNVQAESYNGKTSMKVKYLNPRDYEGGGGIQKADPQEVQSLDAKYGALLRATTKATAPARPSLAKPAAPSGADTAKRAAWDAFKAKTPGTPAEQGEAWKAAFANYFDGRTADSIQSSEWEQFVKDGFDPLPF